MGERGERGAGRARAFSKRSVALRSASNGHGANADAGPQRSPAHSALSSEPTAQIVSAANALAFAWSDASCAHSRSFTVVVAPESSSTAANSPSASKSDATSGNSPITVSARRPASTRNAEWSPSAANGGTRSRLAPSASSTGRSRSQIAALPSAR